MNKKIFARLYFSVVLLALTVAPLASQDAHPTLAGFEASTDFQLLIEGRVDAEAELRFSQTAAAVLITSGNLDGPILVWAGSKRVDQVLPGDLLDRANNAVDLSEGVTRKYLGDFTNEDKEFILPIPGKDVRMRPTPPLLGFQTLAGLLDHSPGYKTGMSQYEPSSAILSKLADLDGVEVKVFFGTWCHVCKNFLPNLLKVHEAIEGSGGQGHLLRPQVSARRLAGARGSKERSHRGCLLRSSIATAKKSDASRAVRSSRNRKRHSTRRSARQFGEPLRSQAKTLKPARTLNPAKAFKPGRALTRRSRSSQQTQPESKTLALELQLRIRPLD